MGGRGGWVEIGGNDEERRATVGLEMQKQHGRRLRRMARLEGTTRNDEVWWGWRCRNSMGGMMKYGGAGDVAVVFDVFWGGPIVFQRLARFNFTTS